MYKLTDFLQAILKMPPHEVPSAEVFCSESTLELTFQTNQMQTTLMAYSYTLVTAGWLRLVYNGQELSLRRGDLYIYSPGFQVNIVSGSDDYHSFCLITDETLMMETPAVRNMIRTAYYPIAELGQPVVHLTDQQQSHFLRRMQEIVTYQHSRHRFLSESLRTLCALFLLDLMDVMEQTIGHHQQSERTTELFVSFMRLLPANFIAHHDIGFYASELCVTTTHLSRIVRQMTGRTVIDYINQMLLMEASWLLQSTSLSISVIATRLNFADQSSFSKFFLRMKGVSPRTFRERVV